MQPILWLLILLAWPVTTYAASIPGDRPFLPGEGLSFDIRLLGIMAAKADLEVSGAKQDGLRVKATARSVGPTESLFHMRSQASCTLEQDLEPSLCRSTSESRGKVKRREIRFEREEGVIQERKMEKGKIDQTKIEVEPGMDGMQDALSGLYMIRANLPEVGGETLRFRTVLKGKAVSVEARTVELQELETPLGTYQTAVVEVRIIGKQDADATTHAKLWITLDENRLPLRATTKAPIGTMEATLVGAKGIKNGKLAQR